MSFLLVYAAVTVLGLLIASYTDLKERIVPNKLSYGLLVAGICLHAVESFTSGSFGPLALSFGGALLAFVFSLLLYKAGAWAGGDVKLFTALGALLPMPVISVLPKAPVYVYPLFPFMILINSVFVAFPFIMLYIFWKTLSNKKLMNDFEQMLYGAVVKGLVLSSSIFGLASLLVMVDAPQFLALPVLLVLAFLSVSVRNGMALALFFLGVWSGGNLESFAFLLLFGIAAGGFFEALVHGMRVLTVETPVSKLREGMISGELVFVERGKVKKLARSLLERARFREPRGTVVSDLSAAGLSKEQIAELKRLGIKSLLVKEAIPLIPILLLGCVVSLVFGDLAWIAIESL